MIPSTPYRPIGVMHVLDTLDIGGRERLAVDLVNLMPRDRYNMHMCTTRYDGLLAPAISDDVGRLKLNRRRTIDFRAIRKLTKYIRQNHISILHAHGTSVVTAAIASLLSPRASVVWHDHFGTNEQRERSTLLYRLLATRVSAVLTASQQLADWSRSKLGLPNDRVSFLPNFTRENTPNALPHQLPGTDGGRIVCVANLRPAKDHPTLLRAMRIVVDAHPHAHLLLVGLAEDRRDYVRNVREQIDSTGLAESVSVLGPREDVPSILAGCDVGVLCSQAEGLPVALLEYGMAGLPVVATRVGQCPNVLNHGKAGVLVPPQDPAALATAIASLMESTERRTELGGAFREWVRKNYSAQSAISHIECVYRQVATGEFHD